MSQRMNVPNCTGVRRWRWRAAIGLALALAAGCRRAPSSTGAPPSPDTATTATATADGGALPPSRTAFHANTFEKVPTVKDLTATGRTLFFAPELSASGKLACASCHDPAFAFGPPNDRAVQLGGAGGALAGSRAAPSLRYLQTVPRFDPHYQDSDGDGTDQGPAGGYTWDGRAETTHEQAQLPLFSPLEMANGSPETLIARLRSSRHAPELRATFGDHVLDTTASGLKAVLMALEVFQQSSTEFYPYDSQYDAYLRGQATLDARATRGLHLFNDPRKGNCASCHPSQVKNNGAFPQFTDYGFVALGVPRNRALRANADAGYFDLGLCGPLRTDLKARKEYCGMFRTPSLRNVTVKRRFFHNGVMSSLKDVLRFYVTRDRQPERWFPRGPGGKVQRFDDLPAQYHANVNVDPPFGRAGRRPALSESELDDLVAFLDTLKDGYRPR